MQNLKQRGVLFHFLDVLFNIVVIVGIVVLIRTFLVSPYQVEGNSMSSTLEDNEYIIINKLAYYLGSPRRGDIVVFRPPTADHNKIYVKRVIGLPGDTVELRDGYVYVKNDDGKDALKLEEPYLDARNLGRTFEHPQNGAVAQPGSYTVPSGQYFLLGDNRQGSLDSRSFVGADAEAHPYVPEGNIKGRVWFVALPVTKIHAFEPPDYNVK